jgi:hypothetical protein
MKLNKFSLALAGLALVVSTSPVLAMPPFLSAELKTPGTNRPMFLPATAIEVAPNVFSLGSAQDVDGRLVEGYAFVDYKEGFHHRPDHAGGPGGGDPPGGGTSDCFVVLAKDAKWKVTEDYLLNPANGDGMSDTFVADTFATSVDEWDDEVGFDIFGAGSVTSDTLEADTVTTDGLNEVYFDTLDPDVVGVTYTWGIFNGRPANRELVEFDMVFNDLDFVWGDADLDNTLMDLNNIAVHELGHALGLGHPEDTCTEESMYRFGEVGETKKRDLNDGDIAGVNELYI